ncbi:MAG: sulfatase-like hydrolase/transferase [Proteobacteria bacterium]|nr:sulfatase-like hydrolase/transferase [Pseudomonadota bacterium]
MKSSVAYLRSFLCYITLTCLAIASPILNILAQGQEFFINKHMGLSEILLTIFILVAIPALIFNSLEIITFKLKKYYQFPVFAVLIFLFLLPTINSFFQDGRLSLIISCFLSLIFGVSLAFKQSLQKILLVFSPIVLIALFNFFSSAKYIFSESNSDKPSSNKDSLTTINAQDQQTDKIPVVLLVLDEFSLNALLTEDINIDEARFPNFARLKNQSYWYRNATTVNQFTPLAVPAILSGKAPQGTSKLPTYDHYPINIFSILAESHEVSVYEPFTSLCPEEVCNKKKENSNQVVSYDIFKDLFAIYLNYLVPPDLAVFSLLPQIDGKWGDFWDEQDWVAPSFNREARLYEINNFIDKIKIRDPNKPKFIFAHTILPHMPYQYTSEGFMYSPTYTRGYVGNAWGDNEILIARCYEQFLTQVGLVDRLLGRLIEKLKAINIFDQSLIVVVADHGVSFEKGAYRRSFAESERFYQDLMSVPLLIKKPNQVSGEVIDVNAQIIDVLPTILDVLGIHQKYKLDGISLFSKQERELHKGVLIGKNPGKDKSNDSKFIGKVKSFEFLPQIPVDTLKWKYNLPGFKELNNFNPFYIGPHSNFIGRKVSKFTTQNRNFETHIIDFKGRELSPILKFQKKSKRCPCNIEGIVRGEGVNKADIVAIAVNDLVIGFSELVETPLGFDFLTLASVNSFVEGDNKVSVYLVKKNGSEIVLQKK